MREIDPLRLVLEHAGQFLTSLDRLPVDARLTAASTRALLSSLPEEGREPVEVISSLIAAAQHGIVRNTGGRFFGWVMGGALPSAMAADWLTSLWDQNAATAIAAPAACAVEEVTAGWLKELLGLPATASYAFTTGCQMAHATCLAAARNGVLDKVGWDVERRGLAGAPAVRVITGSHRHGSVDRTLRLLGLGLDSLVVVQEDEDGKLAPERLEPLLKEPCEPTILVLNAGDLNIGACDPFETLIPMAHASGCWVHIDGAFGLWLRASRTRRQLVAGLEQADSWATDAHKWLNVPYDSGIAFVANPVPHSAAMSMTASYVEKSSQARDPIDFTPEWSRRARALPVYAALQELGRNGLAHLIDRTCDLTLELATRLGALPDAELLRLPLMNQALVRFTDPCPGADAAAHDRRTMEMVRRIRESGVAYFTDTVWRGCRAMRISLVNWRTSAGDIDEIVASVAALLEADR
jgi:glutamate/tyrosine decarboxylase-like PLP-dependent enzyme